eukprot:CAMPEP_0181127044 /NCGR_PEP_ID=MMETSP1071-20121207/27978_1 /TAXON_ID=35127 /ORGANISM="Thalassiosira sp., Strain NH16" /LENGTH=180 /DNA_ID=CAMNT_0023212737 /DNA_START=42 /DNA_END=581 /DNA_ORIENTATION=-
MSEAEATSAKASATTGEEEEEVEDLEKLQAEIARMEAEAARIAQETEDLEKPSASKPSSSSSSSKPSSAASGAATGSEGKDGHSIYIGQVDYSTTPEELLSHFESCGTVERVTIVCDKFTGRPKGFAYVEFQNDVAVENALKLDGSTFKERQLKVLRKRVNDPNFYGGGFRGGRGGGRGG